jgi:hypothetical protein
MRHVVTPEPSSGEWRALCLGVCGGARASWHQDWILSRVADLLSLVDRVSDLQGTDKVKYNSFAATGVTLVSTSSVIRFSLSIAVFNSGLTIPRQNASKAFAFRLNNCK